MKQFDKDGSGRLEGAEVTAFLDAVTDYMLEDFRQQGCGSILLAILSGLKFAMKVLNWSLVQSSRGQAEFFLMFVGNGGCPKPTLPPPPVESDNLGTCPLPQCLLNPHAQ